jgi:hypothetical protein
MKVFIIVTALAAGLFLSSAAQAQSDQVLPPWGGLGGAPFVARCAVGDILTGFELKTADDVDSIRPICTREISPFQGGGRHVFTQKFGGDGGGAPFQLVCPSNAPAIAGVTIETEGEKTEVLNGIDVFCSAILPNEPMTSTPTLHYEGPHPSGGAFNTVFTKGDTHTQVCPRGLVPVGISGRSGVWVDAVGLICGASTLHETVIPSLGRIGGPNREAAPRRPICDAARDARARNSPAAPDLEAQCAALKSPVTSIGRVDTGPSAPRPQRTICDSAVDARARNSPAAANLQAQCDAAGGIAKMRPSDADFELVRANGEKRAANDASAGNIRSSLAEVPRRGFDIGLGIWADQTAPGPGKQRYHDFLNLAEQQGFNFAAAYALPRNKYAGLVDIGAAINAADAQVRARRNAVKDGYYWLGFDIASGLFGNPRMGAQGSKVLGAGAIEIRNSLNAAGQAGFNASMQMHIARNYQ